MGGACTGMGGARTGMGGARPGSLILDFWSHASVLCQLHIEAPFKISQRRIVMSARVIRFWSSGRTYRISFALLRSDNVFEVFKYDGKSTDRKRSLQNRTRLTFSIFQGYSYVNAWVMIHGFDSDRDREVFAFGPDFGFPSINQWYYW